MKRATGLCIKVLMRYDISIHALVKRATAEPNSSEAEILISIHALVKRATVSGYEGSDIQGISIHALVKRATKLFRLA